MYFFSNSPVKWRLTKVVCQAKPLAFVLDCRHIALLFVMLAGVIRRPRQSQHNVRGLTHLSCTAVTNKHELEGRDVAACFGHGCGLLWWGMCDVMRKIWPRRNVSGGR